MPLIGGSFVVVPCCSYDAYSFSSGCVSGKEPRRTVPWDVPTLFCLGKSTVISRCSLGSNGTKCRVNVIVHRCADDSVVLRSENLPEQRARGILFPPLRFKPGLPFRSPLSAHPTSCPRLPSCRISINTPLLKLTPYHLPFPERILEPEQAGTRATCFRVLN